MPKKFPLTASNCTFALASPPTQLLFILQALLSYFPKRSLPQWPRLASPFLPSQITHTWAPASNHLSNECLSPPPPDCKFKKGRNSVLTLLALCPEQGPAHSSWWTKLTTSSKDSKDWLINWFANSPLRFGDKASRIKLDMTEIHKWVKHSLWRKTQNEQKLRQILHVFLNYYVQNYKKKMLFKKKASGKEN